MTPRRSRVSTGRPAPVLRSIIRTSFTSTLSTSARSKSIWSWNLPTRAAWTGASNSTSDCRNSMCWTSAQKWDALDLALRHNFLHRDIKPGNILFNADNEPKLIDFGLARKAEVEHNPDDAAWGTPYYVAPEKMKREPETFLSDMYSLGGTLYHALTGHVPFEAATADEVAAAHVYTPLTPPDQVVPEISPQGSDALVRAMAKNPADRFQSYFEFRMALEAARADLLRERYVQADPQSPAKAKGAWWKKR